VRLRKEVCAGGEEGRSKCGSGAGGRRVGQIREGILRRFLRELRQKTPVWTPRKREGVVGRGPKGRQKRSHRYPGRMAIIDKEEG